MEWNKLWNPFYRMRVLSDIIFNRSVTITAIDFIGLATDPNVIPKTNFTEEELSAGELVFNKENRCWCLERKTKGKIVGDVFYPNKGQSVKYEIRNPQNLKINN